MRSYIHILQSNFVAWDVDVGQQNAKHLLCAVYIHVINSSELCYAHNVPVVCINQQVGFFVYF